MENLSIATLVLLGIQVVVIPWCVWATVSIFSLKQDLALNTQRDGEITKLVDTVNTRLANIDSHLNSILIALAKKGIDVDNPNKQ